MKNLKKWLHNLFVPHQGNDHSPHFWRDRSIGVILAIVLLAELAVFAQSFIVLRKDSYLASVLPGILTSLTNGERLAYELKPVTENPLLVEAAQMKANDMAKRGYFAHNTPEGKLPWYWLDQVGYQYSEAGENLAVNFVDSKDVVDAWMKSPTHKANIVKGSYTEIGIAMADGVYQGHPAVYVAQFFGKPKVSPAGSPSSPSGSLFAKTDAAGATKPASSPSTLAAVAGAKTQTRTKPAAHATTTIATTTKSTVNSTSSAASLSASSTYVSASTSASSSLEIASTTDRSASDASTTMMAFASSTSSSTASTAPQVAGAEIDRDTQASVFQAFAASPRHMAIYVLMTILIIILAAYLIMVFVTRRVHHPRMLFLTIAFVLIIAGLLVFNAEFLKDRMEVGNGESTFMSTSASSSSEVDAASSANVNASVNSQN